MRFDTPDALPGWLDQPDPSPSGIAQIAPGAVVLKGFALPMAVKLGEAIDRIVAVAPLRHMMTPGGFTMSVAMTNCGNAGWITDRRGYRYAAEDPLNELPWPAMPAPFVSLAGGAAAAAGFEAFLPNACLINRYEPGARMSLHQDKNERDLAAPIVSVSLGASAVFLFGGLERGDKTVKVPLQHGDVVVWGGPARLNFHGVQPLKANGARYNLTFRKTN